MPKSILITGCSTGIGYDGAHTLHKRGWQVIAACRQQRDCDRLQKEGLTTVLLDYEDEISIKSALEQTLDHTGGKLDALFNNGAYAIPGPVEDLSRDALRAIFEANFFGYFDLINQLMPLFRKQCHGRIVQCSSLLGMTALRYRGAYNATKFALEGMTDTLRLELRNTDIKIVLIEPGPIKTDFRKNAVKQFEKWIDWENSEIRDHYEKSLLDKLKKAKLGKDPGELGPEAVTNALIKAIEEPYPKPRYFVTWPTRMTSTLRRALPTSWSDSIFAKF